MIFWVGILVGGLFAWLAVKMRFYETWAMLFNIVISVYLAIFLGPVIVDIVPAAGDMPYSDVLAIVCTAVVAFLILHCISYTFLTGQFSVSFPKIFNTLGAALLGFFAGFLVWSFVGLLIYLTPVSQNAFVKEIGFGSQFRQTNVSNICWWCNLVHKAVASEQSTCTVEEAITALLESAEEKPPAATGRPAEPNEPVRADS